MVWFSRKKTSESHSDTQTVPAESREKPPKLDDVTIFDTSCPEVGQHRDRYYRAPADALGQHLGRLAVGQDCATVCRAYYQCVLASTSITALDHFPLQAMVPVHGEHQWDVHRAVFVRALVAGLGAFATNHNFTERNGRPHTLLDDSISKASLVTVARGLPVAPSMAEILVAQKLGLFDLSQKWDVKVRHLFLDSFGLDHHPRNPLVFAIDLAFDRTRRSFQQKGVILPTEVMPTWGHRNAKAELESRFELPGEHVKKLERDQPTAPPVTVPVTRADPSEQEDLASLPVTIRRIVRAISEDELEINRTTGVCHMTREGLSLHVPKAYHLLGELFSVSASDIQIALEDDTYVPTDFRYKQKRKGQGKKPIRLRFVADQHQDAIGRLLTVSADGSLERQEINTEGSKSHAAPAVGDPRERH